MCMVTKGPGNPTVNPAAGVSYVSGQGMSPAQARPANRAGLSNVETPAEGRKEFVPMSTVLGGGQSSTGASKTLLGQ